jgi:tetratricopeptide (TPR) repeat protein
MSDDWYVRSTWTKADEADFFARFKKSRGLSNKAQYLIRQAECLEDTGSKKLLRAAIMLLDMMLKEFPEEFHLAEAHGQKASCLAKLGYRAGAITHYRLALKALRECPGHQVPVAYDFGKFIVENKMRKFYDEVLAAVDDYMKLAGVDFPSEIYLYNGIRAVIAAERKDRENAKKNAQIAFDAANENNSGVKHHPGFGVVQNRKSKFYKSVEAIATRHIKSFSN